MRKEKLVKLFENCLEDLIRVLTFLDEYEKDDNVAFYPYWGSFEAIFDNDVAFEKFAQRLADDTKTAEKNPRHDICENWLAHTDTPLPAGQEQGFDWSRMADVNLMQTLGSAGLARIIPQKVKDKIIALLPNLIENFNSKALITAIKTGGEPTMIELAAVYLTREALRDIHRWWNGEISGKRCAKNIVDATITAAAVVGGGLVGGTVGTLIAGPFGRPFGEYIGAWLSSSVATVLVDRLTQQLFDLPQSEALENAYNYMGVEHSASNAEVNMAFRKLCMKHHPEQGGDEEEYIMLQAYMAIIKQARKDGK